MANNTLTRTESNNELFVYRYTQPSGGAEASVTTLNSPVTGYNNSFNESSGQWRVLNLRVDGGGDAVLEFGFKNDDTAKPLSAICGFTVGQPPLYATHVNTIAKSIAYGFVHSPFTFNDGLYIVHENTLTQVSGTYDISALRIVIKDGEVEYHSGNTLLLVSIMSISGCSLYVVGALGYAQNQITNIGISGASGYTLPVPNYTKELYFLCNGLTNTVPRYPGRLSSGIPQSSLTYLAIRTTAGCTISYPNKEVNVDTSSTNYFALPEPYAAIPFVIKITFNSLANLTGLQFVNGAIGAGSSLSRSINSLTGLTQLEIRGCTERRTLGRNNFPASLNSLYLHGNHDIATPLNTMTSLTSLRYLEQPSNTTSIFELVAFPNLQLLEIPEGVTWNTSSFESFQNFRLMFSPISRSPSTHGFYGSALSSTNHFTLLTNLAIAQQSAALLYGWDIQSSGNNSFISNLINYSSPASGLSGFLFTLSRGDSAIISGSSITLTISSNAGITTDTDNFLTNNQFILVKNGTANNSKQLRRILGIPTKSTSGNIITYTIAVQAVKSAINCTGVTVASAGANTFVMTGSSISSSIENGNIRVGDTVRINSVAPPITGTPSIVIAKTNNSVTVLKGSIADGIPSTNTSISNATVVFDYEFSGTLAALPSLASSDIHISTGTRAIYQYLI